MKLLFRIVGSDEGENDEWRRYWRMMTVAKGEI
jgi:hypothetical protein